MTTLETLIAARELLSDPARLTKDEFARDSAGRPVNPRGDSAVCWCMIGAIEKVGCQGTWAFHLLRDAAGMNLDTFTDNPATTHADVLRIYDLAIERARQS